MNISDIPTEIIETYIINCFDLRTFYRFCVTNKEHSKNLNDNEYWKKYLRNIARDKDPYHVYFKRNYKNNKIILLFKNVKLSLGYYYKNYLVDKYTISIRDSTHNELIIKRKNTIEGYSEPSDIDLLELEMLDKRIELYKARVNRYNSLQYSFTSITNEYKTNYNKRHRELFERNQTRLVKLIEYLNNSDIFEYNNEYDVLVDEVKYGFKKYTKRFSKITPQMCSADFNLQVLLRCQPSLNSLRNKGIIIQQLQEWGNLVTWYFHRPLGSNRYRTNFNYNDRIYGLRFKT